MSQLICLVIYDIINKNNYCNSPIYVNFENICNLLVTVMQTYQLISIGLLIKFFHNAIGISFTLSLVYMSSLFTYV